MGRGGYGVFDSDQAWECTSELDPIIGINLGSAGHPRDDLEEDEMPILSVKDSAAHLNNGHFNRVFDLLRQPNRHYLLVLFVLLSMKVGAKIDKKQLRFIKKIYKKIDDWEHLPECRAQIRFALKEYKDGEPYTLRDFDPDDSQAEDAPPSSDSEKIGKAKYLKKLDEVPKTKKRCRGSKKTCEEDADDIEEEASAKKAKTS